MRALLLVALLGCSNSKRDEPPAPPPPQPALIAPDAAGDLSIAEAEPFVTMTAKLAETVAKHRTECPAMARAINALLDANKDTLAQGAAARASGRQLPPAMLARIQLSVQQIATDLDACVTDNAVQEAFARYRSGAADVSAEVAAADVARIVALVDEVAGAVRKTQTDCPKMAAAIERVIATHADVLRAASAAQAAGKRLPPARLQELIGKVQAMVPLMKKCTGDPAVVAAFNKLELGGH